MTVYLDLPDDLATRLLSKPEPERNRFAAKALGDKFQTEDGLTSPNRLDDLDKSHSDELGAFITKMAAKVAEGGGVERIDRSEMYAERGP